MLSLEEQNRWRQHYQAQRPGWRPATVVFADTVREYLAPEKRLLDVGCGRGGLVEQLHHPLAQTVGVDPDWDSLREHRLASLPRLAGASEALALASAAVDVAFGSWIMEHLAEPEQTLREIRRVLVPGGVFVFITPNGAHPLALVNRLLGRLGRWQGTLVERFYGRAGADAFPTFYRANTPAQLRALAAGAGLRLERLEAVADPTYLLFHPALFNPLVRLEESLPPGRQIHLVGVYCR